MDTEHATHQVDTGFIVMNDRNYPNFTRLLERLGVATQPTHMSFSVKGEEEDFEYCGHPPRAVLPADATSLSPRFQRMIVDLLRFNRALRRLLADGGARVAVRSTGARRRSASSSPADASRRPSSSG